MISLDIVSDMICPWCFIGKARLDAAIAASGASGLFAVQWRPFQLNPDMPAEGADRKTYLEAKFGGAEGARRAYANVEAAAAESGLSIDFSRIPRVPNTVNAHRLLGFARRHGAQHALAEALFRAYFQQGRDLGDLDTLAEIGALHLPQAAAALHARLQSDEGRAEVLAECAQANRAGIGGVPFYIIAGRHGIAGAQPSGEWQRIIGILNDSISQRNAPATPSAE